MIFIVYRTRRKGRPLTPESILARPEKGLVRFGQGPRELYGRGVMLARLLDPADRKTELIPSIEHAHVHRVYDFLQIIGIEHFRASAKSRVDRWDQTWICCQDEAQGRQLMERMQERIQDGHQPALGPLQSAPSPLRRLQLAERGRIANLAFQAEFADEDPSTFFK